MRTEMNTVANELILTLESEAAPARTRSDDDARREEGLSAFHLHALLIAGEVDAGNPAVGEHVDGIGREMCGEVGGQLRTRGLCHTDDVLDARRIVDLTTDAPCHDGYAQPLSGGVDG